MGFTKQSILIILLLSTAAFFKIQAQNDHGQKSHPSHDQKNKANETEKVVKAQVPTPIKLATGSEVPARIPKASTNNNNNTDPSHKEYLKNKTDEAKTDPSHMMTITTPSDKQDWKNKTGKAVTDPTYKHHLHKHHSKNITDQTQNATKAEVPNPEESSDSSDSSDEEFGHAGHASVPIRNSTRRALAKKHVGPCIAYNPIDKCWRCDPNWAKDRKKLAGCAMGFGRRTFGGRDGPIYKVTDPGDDNVMEPRPGTLRHAVIQKTPLWIIFARSMTIVLQQELLMQSDKTIDGRGKNIKISGGAGISIQFVRNIIIHNIHITDIHVTSGGMIRDSVDHMGPRGAPDGDAISIFGSSDIWIDHVSASNAKDGLIDIVAASNGITISNCHFVRHDKVLLFGAEDNNEKDKDMHVTVAYTHFGKNLIQRMPRVRWGFIHLVNNDYTHWLMYAIGGSRGASIISQGNRFIAPPDPVAKEITHRTNGLEPGWQSWNWRSEGDLMMNGAFFVESGSPDWRMGIDPLDLIVPAPAEEVTTLTLFTGPLGCRRKKPC